MTELASELDALDVTTGAPVTARRTWLQAWIEAYPQASAWGLVVEAPTGIVGAAWLATVRRRVGQTIVVVGHGRSDQARISLADPAVAPILAEAIVTSLRSRRRPWNVSLDQLPAGDPVLDQLVRRLPYTAIEVADPSPMIQFDGDRRLRAYVTRKHHEDSRRRMNLLRRDGHSVNIEHLSDPDDLARVLPQVEVVCRRRDRAMGRYCPLDDACTAMFFRLVVLRHACRDEVRLTTLRVNGRLVAYVLCFVDAGFYRNWNCRFDPAFGRYAVGRLACNAAIQLALDDPGATGFDWMRGDESYKWDTANGVVPAVRLRACSSRAGAATTRALGYARKHRPGARANPTTGGD